jgi:hypothetical protein
MQTRKTTAKSTRNKSTRSGSAETSRVVADGPGIEQVDDPIIIKGGSVSLSFGDSSRFIRDNADPKNTFNHADTTKLLTRMVILRLNTVTQKHEPLRITAPILDGTIPLQSRDIIVICYTGCLCL